MGVPKNAAEPCQSLRDSVKFHYIRFSLTLFFQNTVRGDFTQIFNFKEFALEMKWYKNYLFSIELKCVPRYTYDGREIQGKTS